LYKKAKLAFKESVVEWSGRSSYF